MIRPQTFFCPDSYLSDDLVSTAAAVSLRASVKPKKIIILLLKNHFLPLSFLEKKTKKLQVCHSGIIKVKFGSTSPDRGYFNTTLI